MTCANYLGYACSCGGECLEMAKVQIKRIHHNRYRVHEQVYLNPYPKLVLPNHV